VTFVLQLALSRDLDEESEGGGVCEEHTSSGSDVNRRRVYCIELGGTNKTSAGET